MDTKTSVSEASWQAFEYEVWMFVEIRRRRAAGESDTVLRNALVETSLLHIRILVDVLLNRSRDHDDIIIDNLVPQGARSVETTSALKRLRDAYGDSKREGTPCWTINKRLAHLTAVRGPRYDYTDLFQSIEPILEHAILCVAKECGRPKLVQTVDQIRPNSPESGSEAD